MFKKRQQAVEVEEPEAPQIPLDPVTGVPDRSNLGPWLQEAVRQAESESSRAVLAFFQLRDFQEVCDTYGPEVAEKVLAQVAKRLEAQLTEGQKICRYFDEEFAVILPGFSSVERAAEVVRSLLAKFSEPVPVGEGQVQVATAAGCALSDSSYEGTTAWARDAHDALVEARSEGHGALVVHDEATRNRVDVRVTAQRVLKGWAQKEFYLKYQPIVGAADSKIAGVEALLRWRDPGASGTFIGPEQFVHLIEQTGLGPPVGSWVLEEACRQLKQWSTVYPKVGPLFVTVNLSARQIAHPDFAESVVRALDRSGLPPEQLVLDLTEPALRFHKSAAWRELRALKAVGVRLAMDDFGVGEAGVAYLREFPVDMVTIHRKLLTGLGHVAEDREVLKALLDLCRHLGVQTIVEGVETSVQDHQARELEPDFIEGWFYGRPDLPAGIEAILEGGGVIEGSEAWALTPETEPQTGAPQSSSAAPAATENLRVPGMLREQPGQF
ncbi:MAG: hypothetical protein KatS3mg008_1394 [Acidimicrobiales bacterium]|nr:MAG: hypothetical protein KatS3mg008_1394 [Acidimicrobiales bacterium]